MAMALRKQGELGDAHDYCSVNDFLYSYLYYFIYLYYSIYMVSFILLIISNISSNNRVVIFRNIKPRT